MVPTSNAIDLSKAYTNAQLIIYKDAGQGDYFQYHNDFVKSALAFLEQ
jgi:hypothetical protein